MYACMGVHACTYVHISAYGNSKKSELLYDSEQNFKVKVK